jgi:ATP-binding cassette, subfamily B, bacterial
MKLLWKYLQPHKALIFFSLLLAAAAQLLNLVDPIIFGKIIDDYASAPGNRTQSELVKGVSFWLGIALGVAVLARVAKAFQEYTTRLAVARFGMQIFNDGLRQTLRLILRLTRPKLISNFVRQLTLLPARSRGFFN